MDGGRPCLRVQCGLESPERGAVVANASDRVSRRPLVMRQSSTSPFPARAGTEPGIRVHRSNTSRQGGPTLRHGIPVTKPARTLEDLRRTFPRSVFAAALRQAEFLRLPIGHASLKTTPEANSRRGFWAWFVVTGSLARRSMHESTDSSSISSGGARGSSSRSTAGNRTGPDPRSRTTGPAMLASSCSVSTYCASPGGSSTDDDARYREDHPRAAPRGRVSRSALRFRLGPNLGWLDGFDRGGSNLPG